MEILGDGPTPRNADRSRGAGWTQYRKTSCIPRSFALASGLSPKWLEWAWLRWSLIAAPGMSSTRRERLTQERIATRQGAHHRQTHRDRVRDARRSGTGAWKSRRGPRRRLLARRVAGATGGPGVGRGHIRASEEHGRPAPRAKDLRDLCRLLAKRSAGDPVHPAAQWRPQVRCQPHTRWLSRLAGVDARRR